MSSFGLGAASEHIPPYLVHPLQLEFQPAGSLPPQRLPGVGTMATSCLCSAQHGSWLCASTKSPANHRVEAIGGPFSDFSLLVPVADGVSASPRCAVARRQRVTTFCCSTMEPVSLEPRSPAGVEYVLDCQPSESWSPRCRSGSTRMAIMPPPKAASKGWRPAEHSSGWGTACIR